MANKLMEKFTGNSFYLLLEWFGVTLLSFVFWVTIWKTLPPYDAGIIATVMNTIILVTAASTLGMEVAMSKMVSEFSRKNAQAKINYLVGFSNKLLLGVNAAVAVSFLAAVMFFGLEMNLPLSGIVAISAGIMIFPFVISTGAVLQGRQNMKRIFQTNLASNVVKLAVAGVMIFAGFGFMGPLYAIVAAAAVVVILRKDVLLIGKRAKKKIDVRGFMKKYSLPSLATVISWSTFTNTPVIILTLVDTLKSSGIFSAATSMINPLIVIPSLASSALFPITSSLMVTRDRMRTQSTMIKSVVRYTVAIMLPVWVAYIFFSDALVVLFARPEYMEAVSIIPIMAFAAMFRGLGDIFIYSLYAIRRTSDSRNISIMAAVIFLASSLYLTPMMGITGMVWSFVFSVVVFTVVSYVFLRRALRFELPWSDIGKIVLGSAVMFVVLAVPEYSGYGIIVKLPFLLMGGLLYLLILGLTGFYSKEDLTLIKFSEKKLPFIAPVSRIAYKIIKKISMGRI